MNLALFDIDGTLTDTNHVDSECFVDALASEFGIRGIDEDWSAYPHTTDRGILTEVLRRAWSRQPDEEELVTHRRRFLQLLSERMPSPHAVAGAVEFLDVVRSRGWSVVLCTGAWGDSARLKLSRAGFAADLRVISCDSMESREEILKAGIDVFGRKGGGNPPHSKVVFGDAIWDVRAARNLNLPFIAVSTDTAAERLRAEGAEAIIADYRDSAAVLRLMSEARAPR